MTKSKRIKYFIINITMNIRVLFLLIILCSLQTFAQNQKVTYKCRTDFSKNYSTILPPDWYFNGESHQFAIDSLNHNECKALKITGIQDSIKPSVLSLATLPLNQEDWVTFSMKIKTQSNNDSLLMAISAMDTMSTQWIKGTTEWKEYQVSIPLSNKSQIMIPQIMFPGTGPYWLSETTVEMTKKTFPAEDDHEFDSSSTISSIPLNKSNIDKLALTGKVWGFLKYYHPVVCNGQYNWDYELFRWLPSILKSKSKKEVCDFLFNSIMAMGNLNDTDSINSNYPQSDSLYYSIPSFSWLEEISHIHQPLFDLLKSIMLVDRSHTAFYYNKGLNSMNSFPTEVKYGENIYPDTGYRLLALFRYWNIIEYFYPYRKNITDKTWDDIIYKFIPLFINARNVDEYRSTIDYLGTFLKDNHTSRQYSDSIPPSEKRNYYLPVFWDFVDKKLTVTDNFIGQSKLKKGDIICKINGVKVDELVKQYSKVISASNEHSLLYAVSLDLIQQRDSVTILDIKRNDMKENISISGFTSKEYFPLKAKSLSEETYYKWISESIGYFSPIGQYRSDSLSIVMNKFKDAKAIILDMRNYPCDLLHHIADYLLPHRIGCTRTTSVDTNFPGFIKWNDIQYFGNENPAYYKGKVIVLINEKTVSMGESIVAILRHCPNAILVGSPTAGSDGPISTFTLPGGVHVRFTGEGFYYSDKKAIQNTGILPDVKVCSTKKGIDSNIDELLQKALDIIK